MDIFVVSGGTKLSGEVSLGGAKNVALKASIASLLTGDAVVLHNFPQIGDTRLMFEVLRSLGVSISFDGRTAQFRGNDIRGTRVPLEIGARLRTSSMVIGPLLARFGEAKIPNPGGCRIGARPIDRHIEAIKLLGAKISYSSTDGYFYATADKLTGAHVVFPKNTHTGTETVLLAAVLARGTTTIDNAAEEVEVDDLISLLNAMGAKIRRLTNRQISIEGVESLHGTEYEIMSDRNEEVTFAIAAAVTGGSIVVEKSQRQHLDPFLSAFEAASGIVTPLDQYTTRYELKRSPLPSHITTVPHPGFMTDWQAPWAVLMTQATGTSTIHETVFESRFSYVTQLKKMGAKIEFFDPDVTNPESFYNFNWSDRDPMTHQAIKIIGPTPLHNAVIEMGDLRAGATLLLAAIKAEGESYVHGVEQIDRGYERVEDRFNAIGARIRRVKEESV